MKLDAVIPLFFEWIDTNRLATYEEINAWAKKHKVKVDTLLRRTRNNDECLKGSLTFIKYGFDGKPIKGSRLFKTLRAVGHYNVTEFKKV